MLRTPGDLIGRPATRSGPRLPHVHLFRRQGDDLFSSASLYACRCGVVRAGM